uniref:Uncharacterized protein n=1 Tax=Alexandrium monilatum TaxID=311494 RepID=A0A7S4VIT3_9DINO|mmetsp:Transcript_80680/g.251576  ORF Transcript_80680/g.251576 Transcript_80680/m.251576 type:complete len:203 (+) Transcript_80680:23-631(+)
MHTGTRVRKEGWVRAARASAALVLLSRIPGVYRPAFAAAPRARARWAGALGSSGWQPQLPPQGGKPSRSTVARRASQADAEGQSLRQAAGAGGVAAALVVAYSEYTLKTTGCGLPGGPLGLEGAAEGISYLIVTSLVLYSLFTLATTGRRLSEGSDGLLGVAEGLAYLVSVAGLVVLYFQLRDYGFVPEAVPVEGGRCSDIG